MVHYFGDIWQAVSSVVKGMGVTIKHIVRKPVTLQYPDERWVFPERFRGFVHNNIIRCNACLQCAKACPVSCIYIETEGKGKDRHMTRWAVDFNKCIWCGFCADPCPTQAVTMSHDYDHSLYFRQKFVYEFVPPDKPVPCHKEKRLEMGYYVEEKAPPAAKKKPAAKPQDAAAEDPEAKEPMPKKASEVTSREGGTVPETTAFTNPGTSKSPVDTETPAGGAEGSSADSGHPEDGDKGDN
jgi:NADH-quinone oxidoreductase chain I